MRFRKSDRELLASIDNRVIEGLVFDEHDGALRKAWSSFYTRVHAEELKKTEKVTGYPVRDAVETIRGVLGRRAVIPQTPPKLWFIQLQNRINASGLDKELIAKAARIAMKEWRGPIKAESVIRQADTLLSEAVDGPTVAAEATQREYLDDY